MSTDIVHAPRKVQLAIISLALGWLLQLQAIHMPGWSTSGDVKLCDVRGYCNTDWYTPVQVFMGLAYPCLVVATLLGTSLVCIEEAARQRALWLACPSLTLASAVLQFLGLTTFLSCQAASWHQVTSSDTRHGMSVAISYMSVVSQATALTFLVLHLKSVKTQTESRDV